MGAPQWSTRDLADAWNMVAFFDGEGSQEELSICFRGAEWTEMPSMVSTGRGSLGKGGHHSLGGRAKPWPHSK